MTRGTARARRLIRSLPTCVACLVVSGCMVGPEFDTPRAPDIARYDEVRDPSRMTTSGVGGTQTVSRGTDLPADWWTLFRSPDLDRLVRRGLVANPTIAQAEATLRQNQALADVPRAGLYPVVGASASRSGVGYPGQAGGSIYGLYGATVDVSYTVDLFGGVRRGIEARTAEAEMAAYAVQAADLAITANIVAAAIQEASLSAQIAVSETIKGRYEDQLRLVKVRNTAGAEPISSVLTQESLIHSEDAVIFLLEETRARTRHTLAVLTGETPSAYDAPGFTLASLPLPGRLPVRLPSRLIEARPDIKAAEASLHAASAEIGVTTANLLPNIVIAPSLAGSASSIAGLAASSVWTAAVTGTQTLYDGGALRGQNRAAVAAYDAALAVYKATVLTALQNVADALTALASDAKVLTAATRAEDLAKRSLAVSDVEYKAGALTYANLLVAETAFASATIIRLQAQAQRLTDTAALFQVLGGGWTGDVAQSSIVEPRRSDLLTKRSVKDPARS